ncbi:hypothetical protein [Pantoea agglomerans]|uniref:hypothetical protein n=1 Tax=Enterobacter agglomerans TaxID=549 RepID=UPI003209B445
MNHFEDVRLERVQAGWKRGAFVRLAENTALFDELPNKMVSFLEDKKNPLVIPVLYDCALIEESFEKEPWAQVLICWEIEACSGNYAHAKNPRTLHTTAVKEGESISLEFTAMSFTQVDREVLLSCSTDNSLSWEPIKLAQLLDWVAERFRQPTFPDSFNNRLRPVERRLNAEWKSEVFREFCAGVYFKLNTYAELLEHEAYTLDVIIAIPESIKGKEFALFDMKHSQNMIQGIKTKISPAKGIQVGNVEVLSESEFTKAIERNYLRFSLEYFSYKSQSGEAVLPAEFNSAGW